MRPDERPVVFEGRTDAGHRLAKRLGHSRYSQGIVVGIARGGILVAATAAHRLHMPWNVMVTRSLVTPWYPQAGFGVVASDGSSVLNDPMLRALDIPRHDVDEIADRAVKDARRQAELYASRREPTDLNGRSVILVDDVLISGYTMLAAIKSARLQGAGGVIVAAPLASRSAANLVESSADECIFDIVSPSIPFSPADFYVDWPELDDGDVMDLLGCERGDM